MHHAVRIALLLALTAGFVACAEEAAPPAAVEPALSPTETAATPAPASAAPLLPEDTVHDADREALIRKKAEELKALRPEDVTDQKVGTDAVVLVRGVVSGHGAGTVWGSDPYTLDSNIRTAAVHAGVLRDGELGLVRVLVFTGASEYASVERNGVRPNTWGQYHASYTVKKVQAQ